MEPYSYDLFASENIPAIIWGAVIFLSATAIGMVPFIPLGKREFLAWFTLIICSVTGGFIGWNISHDIVAGNNNEDRLADLIKQTDNVYGITLTEKQAEELRPPLGTPSASYKEFGRSSVDFMDGKIPVILVWNDGVLFYAVEGTDSSLPTKKQMAQQTAEVTPEPTLTPSE